jgi:hypothetical protein
MSIPIEIILWALGFIGTGMLTGIGAILKSLGNQNKTLSTQGNALALLVARVGNINPEVVDKRLLDLETDMARVWGIYDAWRGPSSPVASDRMAGRN